MKMAQRRHRGQSLVEFALSLPVLVMLLAGGFYLSQGIMEGQHASDAIQRSVSIKKTLAAKPEAIDPEFLRELGGNAVLDKVHIVKDPNGVADLVVGHHKVVSTGILPDMEFSVVSSVNNRLMGTAHEKGAVVRPAGSPWAPAIGCPTDRSYTLNAFRTILLRNPANLQEIRSRMVSKKDVRPGLGNLVHTEEFWHSVQKEDGNPDYNEVVRRLYHAMLFSEPDFQAREYVEALESGEASVAGVICAIYNSDRYNEMARSGQLPPCRAVDANDDDGGEVAEPDEENEPEEP